MVSLLHTYKARQARSVAPQGPKPALPLPLPMDRADWPLQGRYRGLDGV